MIFLTGGVFSMALGCLTMSTSLFDWIMADLLEMRSYTPIYKLWQVPPHVVTFSVNIFEAVNHEEFLTSDDPNVNL